MVRRREDGKLKRSYHASKSEADKLADSLRLQQAGSGKIWPALGAQEQAQLTQIFHEAKSAGLDLHDLIRQRNLPAGGPTVQTVIAELKAAKRGAGRSERYVNGLGIVLDQFARAVGSMPICGVKLAVIETFLHAHSLAYRPTLRARLSTLFNFAVRRGYCLANPCAQLEPIKITKAPPAIFSTRQTAKAILWLAKHRPRALAWFVLTTCCGLRPEEAQKTDPRRDIHLKEKWVKVEAQTTKVRQRRIIYPRREAMKLLLAVLKRSELPLAAQPKKRTLHALREVLFFDRWPKDITRHTAASYWLADDGSAAHVADMLGNSEKILKRDYKALVTRKEAKAFWALILALAKRLGKSRQ